MTQSAVSHVLKSLEDEFNIQLITRDKVQGMTIAPIGQQLYEDVKQLLELNEKIEQQI